MSNKKFKIIKVNNDEQIEKIRAFKKMFHCQGSSGKIKIITTSAGYSLYTSSSRRLLQYLEISDPLLSLISQCIKSHLEIYNDFGLYFGLFSASLLENIYIILREFSFNDIQKVLDKFLNQIQEILYSPLLKIELDLSSIHQLFPLIRGIIQSKPSIQFSKSECENLSWKLIKSAIERIENQEEIIVKCTDFGEEIILSSGLLYCWQNDYSLPEHSQWTLVIFDIMLDDINYEQDIINFVDRLKINMLVSQKVVHPELQFILKRRGVLVLERMGTEQTRALCKMTGIDPISDIRNLENIKLFGCLSSLTEISYGANNYIKLESNNKYMTLLIPSKNEETTQELQIVCNQALASLQLFFRKPFITFGGGCAETRLILLLNQKVPFDSPIEKKIYQILIKSLLYHVDKFATYEFDTLAGHLWSEFSKVNGRCRCQMYSFEEIQSRNKSWHPIAELEHFQENKFNFETIAKNFIPSKDSLIDLHSSKSAAILNSIRTVIEVSEIGIFIER